MKPHLTCTTCGSSHIQPKGSTPSGGTVYWCVMCHVSFSVIREVPETDDKEQKLF